MFPSAKLDLGAVRDNVRTWRRIARGRPIWPVVKCDAYRMGIARVAHAVIEGGAERLCVIDVAEAAELRAAGVRQPIVQVCATPERDFEAALRLDVIPTLQDAALARSLAKSARALGVTARVHVAVDTGGGWSGISDRDAAAFAKETADLSNIEWEGAWTHIAGRATADIQIERFNAVVSVLRNNGLAIPLVHSASTGPTLWGIDQGALRIGIGLYGSTLQEPSQAGLRTALEIQAPIFMVKRFTEPTPLGYGGDYTTSPGERIVTLRIGYGEGLQKSLAGRGHALLGETRCPIVGAIGMNFTMVALPANAPVPADGYARLIGDVDGLRLDDVAIASNTIPHTVLTSFGTGMSVLAASESLSVEAAS